MAMVTAKRNGHRIKVSRNAYETLFKPKGYILEGGDRKARKEPVRGVESETANVEEIPISEMSKEQLAEFAKLHNIDTSEASSVSQARKIIQRYIREQKM